MRVRNGEEEPTRAELLARARSWASHRTYRAADLPSPDRLVERKGDATISVVLPALNEAETVGAMCATIRRELMEAVRLVDELMVVDGGSTDVTTTVAEDAGATVLRAGEPGNGLPAATGKGDALWRSLIATSGDIVCWVDADIEEPSARFVHRLVAPLLVDHSLAFVKGFYRRPLHGRPNEGGRVTELLARPLLDLAFPELSGFLQPLAGEYVGRRSVLEGIPFRSGYGVEVAMLIDLLSVVDLDGMGQVDLDRRVHRNRPLGELAPMAHAIARTIVTRAEARGRLFRTVEGEAPALLRGFPEHDRLDVVDIDLSERPPVASVVAVERVR